MVVTDTIARTGALPDVLKLLRSTQGRWSRTPVRERVAIVRNARRLIAERAESLAGTVARSTAETLSSEVLPLAEACRFLEKNAERLLASRPLGGYSPLWLRSVRLTLNRDPYGIVLIIGPGNYPLFLIGVQVLQALTAGNAVLLKPGSGGLLPAAALLNCIYDAGMPRELVFLLGETPEHAQEAIRAGVDKVILTGSSDTGKAVLSLLAPQLTPATMELSGCDPVFVLPDADISLTAAALRFGITLNAGKTCIRPRRVFACAETLRKLTWELQNVPHHLRLTPVSSLEEALQRASESPYALGASVFGDSRSASELAQRIRAGVVVVNDVIVPTAHPAIPFGGRGSSGFGVTRGAEGLLELTTPKTIAVQDARWRPHLEAARPGDARMFSAFIRTLHSGSLRHRFGACLELIRALWKRRREV